MNNNYSITISYENIEKIIEEYFKEQGEDVSVIISNEVDNDRFPGEINTSMYTLKTSTIAGVEATFRKDLSIDDFKEILNFVLLKENKVVLSLKNNVNVSQEIEGYGYGEERVSKITNKTFTLYVEDKSMKRTLSKQ